MHHKTLAPHGDDGELSALTHKGLAARYVSDVALSAGVPGALLGGVVVEVMGALVAGKQAIHPFQCEGLYSEGSVLLVVVL